MLENSGEKVRAKEKKFVREVDDVQVQSTSTHEYAATPLGTETPSASQVSSTAREAHRPASLSGSPTVDVRPLVRPNAGSWKSKYSRPFLQWRRNSLPTQGRHPNCLESEFSMPDSPNAPIQLSRKSVRDDVVRVQQDEELQTQESSLQSAVPEESIVHHDADGVDARLHRSCSELQRDHPSNPVAQFRRTDGTTARRSGTRGLEAGDRRNNEQVQADRSLPVLDLPDVSPEQTQQMHVIDKVSDIERGKPARSLADQPGSKHSMAPGNTFWMNHIPHSQTLPSVSDVKTPRDSTIRPGAQECSTVAMQVGVKIDCGQGTTDLTTPRTMADQVGLKGAENSPMHRSPTRIRPGVRQSQSSLSEQLGAKASCNRHPTFAVPIPPRSNESQSLPLQEAKTVRIAEAANVSACSSPSLSHPTTYGQNFVHALFGSKKRPAKSMQSPPSVNQHRRRFPRSESRSTREDYPRDELFGAHAISTGTGKLPTSGSSCLLADQLPCNIENCFDRFRSNEALSAPSGSQLVSKTSFDHMAIGIGRKNPTAARTALLVGQSGVKQGANSLEWCTKTGGSRDLKHEVLPLGSHRDGSLGDQVGSKILNDGLTVGKVIGHGAHRGDLLGDQVGSKILNDGQSNGKSLRHGAENCDFLRDQIGSKILSDDQTRRRAVSHGAQHEDLLGDQVGSKIVRDRQSLVHRAQRCDLLGDQVGSKILSDGQSRGKAGHHGTEHGDFLGDQIGSKILYDGLGQTRRRVVSHGAQPEFLLGDQVGSKIHNDERALAEAAPHGAHHGDLLGDQVGCKLLLSGQSRGKVIPHGAQRRDFLGDQVGSKIVMDRNSFGKANPHGSQQSDLLRGHFEVLNDGQSLECAPLLSRVDTTLLSVGQALPGESQAGSEPRYVSFDGSRQERLHDTQVTDSLLLSGGRNMSRNQSSECPDSPTGNKSPDFLSIGQLRRFSFPSMSTVPGDQSDLSLGSKTTALPSQFRGLEEDSYQSAKVTHRRRHSFTPTSIPKSETTQSHEHCWFDYNSGAPAVLSMRRQIDSTGTFVTAVVSHDPQQTIIPTVEGFSPQVVAVPQLLVEGHVIEDSKEEMHDPRMIFYFQMLFLGVICFGATAVALIIGLAVTSTAHNNSQLDLASWNQSGNDLLPFGSMDVEPEEPMLFFGQEVAISGDGSRVAIAAPGTDNGRDLNVGAVYLFEEKKVDNGLDWIAAGVIQGVIPCGEPKLSIALSAGGTRLVVGRPLVEPAGEVEIYDMTDNAWSSVAKFAGYDSNENSSMVSHFGHAVSLSHDGMTVAVGAPLVSFSTGQRMGRVRIYDNEGTDWAQLGMDIAGDESDELLGWSIAVEKAESTLRVAVGAPGYNGETGRLRIFDCVESSWIETIVIEGRMPLSRFGESVSFSQDATLLAVGARGLGFEPGEVFIFREIQGVWVSNTTFPIAGDEPAEGFGSSVSLSGDGSILAVGSPQSTYKGTSSGRVAVYKYDSLSGSWQPQGQSLGRSTGDEFGSSVALAADLRRIVIGSPSATYNGNLADVGVALIYDALD